MEIDFSPIQEFFAQPIDVVAFKFFLYYGWMILAVMFLFAAGYLWLVYIRQKWFSTQIFTLLAIDIPRGNEQTPKAVENVVTYFAGMHGTFNLIGKYWDGFFQLSFSLEIISIGGYIQFLIRVPSKWRDLVESAIYSQYPDAEVAEVEDYADAMPKRFPHEEYDVFGWEWMQMANKYFPIRTYEEFEHQYSKDNYFKDPLSGLMNLMGSLKKGEQVWYQIVLIPLGFDWQAKGDDEIGKILGEKKATKKGLLDGIIGFFNDILWQFIGEAVNYDKNSATPDAKGPDMSMMNLKPKTKKQIEAIQEKASKVGFEFKIRMVYFHPLGQRNPAVINGFAGFMKQFTDADLNGFKPDSVRTATFANYLFVDSRLNKKKNNIVRGYVDRDDVLGVKPGLITVDELATIWHFPVESSVKVSTLKRVEGRKAEAPMSLPVSGGESEEAVDEDLFASNSMASQEVEEELFGTSESDGAEEQSVVSGYVDKKSPPPIGLPEEGREEIKKENSNENGKNNPPSNLPF